MTNVTDNDLKYWAFLSYSQADNAASRPDGALGWGDWLHTALQTFSVPADFVGHPNARGEVVPERLDAIFKDDQESAENATLNADTRAALEQSRCLIVICSPRSAKSLHVNEAVRQFKRLGRSHNILAIVIAGEPNVDDGHRPGMSPEDECFVPAMRHPLLPDGTLDTTRKERGYVFADARQGTDKHEVEDPGQATAELEMAKIQLIAGLIGVGFNGLLRREQNRTFTGYAAAQRQAREAQAQLQAARDQAQAAQNQLQGLQHQAREAQSQLEEARNQVREAQNKVLEVQNLPQDVHTQIQDAQQQARTAQDQARETQSRLTEAQQQAAQAQGEAARAKTELAQAKDQVEQAKHEAAQAQGQLQALQDKVSATENQLIEARQLVQVAESRVVEAQNQAREAQAQLAQARNEVAQTQSLLEEARQQARLAQEQAAPGQVSPAPAVSPELHNQLQEAQEQAQQRAHLAQEQAHTIQNRLTELEGLLTAMRDQVQTAENRVLEAQGQAGEAQAQLEASRQQTRDAENKILEVQNLPPEVQGQIQEAQQQARTAQDQTRATQGQLAEAQQQLAQAQAQLQVFQDKVRDTENQLAEARQQVQAAESKVLAAEAQAREAQNQVTEAQNQLAQAKNEAAQAKEEATQAKAEAAEARNEAGQARRLVAQTKGQLENARQEVQATRGQVVDIETRSGDAHNQIQLAQDQGQIGQVQLRQLELQSRNSRRLIRAFAVLAVLGLLSAAITGTIAWRQNQAAHQAPMQVASVQTSPAPITPAAPATNIVAALVPGQMNADQIQQTLQSLDGADQVSNQLHNLDALAAGISTNEIPGALQAAPVIVNDRQRSHFQKQLLVRLAEVDPRSAMTQAGAIPGKILNEDGAGDSHSYFQLAVLSAWMKTDLPGAFDWSCQLTNASDRDQALETITPALATENPTNTLARLNALIPVPDENVYTGLFQCWAANDPEQALQLRQQTPDQDAGGRILNTVMVNWMDHQPEAALAWAKSQPDSESKNIALSAGILELAKTDAPKALALIQTMPEGAWRDTVTTKLFLIWAEKDLDAATAACQQLPEGVARERAWELILPRRIANDPATAADQVNALAPGDFRRQCITALCQRWTNTNALAWAQALTSETERTNAVNLVVAGWAQQDPQAAQQFAGQHPELSTSVWGDIAGTWSQHDLTATTNWIASLPDGEKKDAALLAVAGASARNTPELAAQFCAQLTTRQPQPELVQDIAGSLAQHNFTNAVTWAGSLKDDRTRQAALAGLANAWAQNDPKGMATYALGLPAGDEQTRYLTAACSQLAAHDWPGTVALLQPLADASLRQAILKQAAHGGGLSGLDPLSKDIAAMPAGDDQQAAIQGLLSSWSPADPASALNWLCAFPETNPQTNQVQSVIQTWAQHEPAAVAQWLAKLPAGAASDEMIGAFLDGAVVKYPEYAAQWTQSVPDAVKRQQYRLQVMQQWLKTDPAAANKWLESLNLPPDIKLSYKTPAT